MPLSESCYHNNIPKININTDDLLINKNKYSSYKDRIPRSKKYKILYNNIPFSKIYEHYHRLLNDEEIQNISKPDNKNNILVELKLNKGLELYKKHKLVSISKTETPIEISNVPKTKQDIIQKVSGN